MEVREASVAYGDFTATAVDSVPVGYKRTEVGLIPEGWEPKEIHEFAAIKTGPFGTMLKASEYAAGDGVPLISVGEIREGFLRVSDHTPRVAPAVTRRLPQYILRKGDIVFGRKGGVERSALVREWQDGWFLGSDGIRIRASRELCSEYLGFQFQSARVQQRLLQDSIGTTMPSLNQGVLRSISIPLPASHAEQVAIAEALSDADALIESLEQLLAKKRQIKQGTMQALLTGKKRLPGFDGEWIEATFEDIAARRTQRIDPRRSGVQDFCVELEHIESGTGVLNGYTTTTSQSSLKSVFQPGDILFGKLRAYLRKYWLANRHGVCSTEIWCLVPKGALRSNALLFQLIQMDAFIEAASMSYGTHMPRSDWNAVKGFVLELPSDESEQFAIAAVLSDMDTELTALDARLAKARQLKRGMMQVLLTGAIRLPLDKAG